MNTSNPSTLAGRMDDLILSNRSAVAGKVYHSSSKKISCIPLVETPENNRNQQLVAVEDDGSIRMFDVPYE